MGMELSKPLVAKDTNINTIIDIVQELLQQTALTPALHYTVCVPLSGVVWTVQLKALTVCGHLGELRVLLNSTC